MQKCSLPEVKEALLQKLERHAERHCIKILHKSKQSNFFIVSLLSTRLSHGGDAIIASTGGEQSILPGRESDARSSVLNKNHNICSACISPYETISIIHGGICIDWDK